MEKICKNILFLGAHLDDIELGCGGLISKLQKKKCYNIFFLTLSHYNKNSEGKITIDRDVQEAYNAAKEMNIKKEQIFIEDIPAQIFEENTQKIREILIQYREKINPDIIFFPSKNDIHQDHQVVCKEGERIFRNKICMGYELIRSCYHLKPNFYVSLSQEEVNKKINSIKCYQSQLTQSSGYYFGEETILSNAIFRGKQCNRNYAEAFEIYYCTID